MSYQGWPNWDTWEMTMWLDHLSETVEAARLGRLEQLARSRYGEKGPGGADLNKVDWKALEEWYTK